MYGGSDKVDKTHLGAYESVQFWIRLVYLFSNTVKVYQLIKNITYGLGTENFSKEYTSVEGNNDRKK